jgi:hypothetical protein
MDLLFQNKQTGSSGSWNVSQFGGEPSLGCYFSELSILNTVEYTGIRGHDRMVVGFKTTCVISAYHY